MIRRLIILCLILVLGFLGIFVWVDQRVQNGLNSRSGNTLSAIYSDSLKIDSGTPLSWASLKTRLLTRRYHEAQGTTVAPGEFRLQNDRLQLVTREFVGPEGSLHPSQEFEMQLNSGQIWNRTYPEDTRITLEPIVLTTLGGGEVRASSYRKLSEIPKFVGQALMSVEDQRFYHHHGIDVFGILRAIVRNVRAMRVVEGGSTVTQQLAKNLIFTPERTLGRKFLEIFGALSLEYRLSKDEILELYLNEVYLGQEGPVAVHGVGEAANSFFGKKVEDLNLSESAMLAGIIKAPSFYSPRRHPKRALERRNLVLSMMKDEGYIDANQELLARAKPLGVLKQGNYHRTAPHFLQSLSSELERQFNVDAAVLSGLRVYTGIDVDFQRCAEFSVQSQLAKLEKSLPALTKKGARIEVGLVSIEPHSGKVRAWVGGRDFTENQFDHVQQAQRQMGSTFKPFLYLTGLDPALNRYKPATPISILSDRPMRVDLVTKDSWEPENYDREFHGDVTLRYALENSLNIPAVYVAEKVGIRAVVSTARNFHVSENLPEVPALALGAADTNLLSLTASYGGLANLGLYVKPRMFVSALDDAGVSLASTDISESRAADEGPVYVLTNLLQGVVERGTARTVRTLGYQGTVAGKTGTSNDTRDAWFIGYDPELTTGVWLGFDDNRKIGYTGGKLAVPIWTEYMKCVAPFRETQKFLVPPGVTYVDIDSVSGQRAGTNCPRDSVVRELFVTGTEPSSLCKMHNGSVEEIPESEIPSDFAPQPRRERSFWGTLLGD